MLAAAATKGDIYRRQLAGKASKWERHWYWCHYGDGPGQYVHPLKGPFAEEFAHDYPGGLRADAKMEVGPAGNVRSVSDVERQADELF